MHRKRLKRRERGRQTERESESRRSVAFRGAAVEQSSPSLFTSNWSHKTILVGSMRSLPTCRGRCRNDCRCDSHGSCKRPTTGQDPPPETPPVTDRDLAAMMIADGDVTKPRRKKNGGEKGAGGSVACCVKSMTHRSSRRPTKEILDGLAI